MGEIELDYDDASDVLYASVGEPQPAIEDEVDDDIGLRYVPPSPQVVGITIVNFRDHFPREDPRDVVQRLLRQYPEVPWSVDE